MASYRIEWKQSARKELKRVERDALGRILAAVESLAANPRPPGCRKLVGTSGAYRIREGNYRVLYTIEEDRLIVEIIRVGHRSIVYKK
ncbi:type II toxin-antitoxin system mRNA interferase toxin, RelE/StbE family [Thiocapsa imhoffii]|uniref:Type II toxin-antitoxin system mRNA interferase toxin, RelE/StbE family n=1 Tax=Thiocapsa imhoffii TaxID=382777 RepID=A0A9X1B9F1_9GAMM|nr:type II toxin-antitoxin system RelE/ParE family toxin [Thiocapsa imhoffii]MBK1645889.1 type II toxin-antitoxin system mRNA interferase toxin, RelE/StbE family [Thiocapsa imhoffii]